MAALSGCSGEYTTESNGNGPETPPGSPYSVDGPSPSSDEEFDSYPSEETAQPIKTDSDDKTPLEYSDDDINDDSFCEGEPKDEDEWEEDECSDEREREKNRDQPP